MTDKRWGLIVLTIWTGIVCILGFAVYLPFRSARMMGEFSALWNTTDAIHLYVGKNREWPRDWISLASSLATVGGDISEARNRVDVNFELDCQKPPQPQDWYVHLKSCDIPAEEREANERLRDHLIGLSRPARR